MKIEAIFNEKRTENGDVSYKSTLNPLLDLLFMTEYYQKHLDEVKIGTDPVEKLFAMFIRDPRFGMGRRDLGRKLLQLTGASYEEILKSGRADDLFALGLSDSLLSFLKAEIENGNELVKKWMPRYSSKNLLLARQIAKSWGMNKQTYGKFIKCNTTENKLSSKKTNEIEFEHVPSLALLKYYKRFLNGKDTSERFVEYLKNVKSGDAKLNISTTNVYDVYQNRDRIDADLFFDKLEKISGSWIPIVDSSGSMQDMNDSYGKAMAIGHYLAKCSTYAPNKVISFSSDATLLELGVQNEIYNYWRGGTYKQELQSDSQYGREIESMYTGDCSNTDFGAVMKRLRQLDKENAPEYIIVLSDMEFDQGSSMSKDKTMKLFKENGFNTKIIWWNLNNRRTTAPETDEYGNIFMSGYNPMLLKYLKVGFDGNEFLRELLVEYFKKINN